MDSYFFLILDKKISHNLKNTDHIWCNFTCVDIVSRIEVDELDLDLWL